MHFHENLQEYFSAQNQFLIIKMYINKKYNLLLALKNALTF